MNFACLLGVLSRINNTVKVLLKTTYIKQSTALRDHCSDTTPLLKSTSQNMHLKTTCCKRPLSLLPFGGL